MAELRVVDVRSGYGDMEILHGVSILARSGKVTCLLGPNGCGKSTLANTAMGIVRPTSGEVLLDDEEITGLKTHEIVRHGIAKLSQGLVVFPQMSVKENLLVGAHSLRDRSLIGPRTEKVFGMFPSLRGRLKVKAGNLSGGEQVMLCISRVLMMEPKVLILDEPSLGLSPKLINIVYDQVRTIADGGTTILLIEQNVRKALAVGDHAFILDLGRNRADGECKALAASSELEAAYFGRPSRG
ncbi:MAG: ABC transporter ATP-binding protein [Nitrososphaerales archaeon]